MNSRFALEMDICGRRVIGRTTTLTGITGCRERGCWRRSQDFCGRRAGGAGAAAHFSGTADIGDRTSVSTAELTMDLDTSEMDLKADVGRIITSSTTPRSCM